MKIVACFGGADQYEEMFVCYVDNQGCAMTFNRDAKEARKIVATLNETTKPGITFKEVVDNYKLRSSYLSLPGFIK